MKDIFTKRHSVRDYKEKAIERDKELEILKIVRSAPSAGNLKAYGIIRIRDFDQKLFLAVASLEQMFICDAPLVLIFYTRPKISMAKYGERGRLYSMQDATIAAAYAQLGATKFGLGSCWVGAFNTLKVAKMLNLPKDDVPIAIITIGYEIP